MPRHTPSSKAPPGQRQLRVGEEIRHALSQVFMRGELHIPEMDGISITVSEVKISPDLKNATAYIMPLGGQKKDVVVQVLADLAPMLRSVIGNKIRLRYVPRLSFRLDTTFEEAGRIQTLLSRPEVVKDLSQED